MSEATAVTVTVEIPSLGKFSSVVEHGENDPLTPVLLESMGIVGRLIRVAAEDKGARLE